MLNSQIEQAHFVFCGKKNSLVTAHNSPHTLDAMNNLAGVYRALAKLSLVNHSESRFKISHLSNRPKKLLTPNLILHKCRGLTVGR